MDRKWQFSETKELNGWLYFIAGFSKENSGKQDKDIFFYTELIYDHELYGS